MGFRNDIILASIDKEFNPHAIFTRAEKMTRLYNSIDGKNFLKAFKRLNSLNEDTGNQSVEVTLLKKEEEKKPALDPNKPISLDFLTNPNKE